MLLLVALSTACPETRAASSDEHVLMAVYIYNFAKFTRWPEWIYDSAAAPIQLCVLGEDPFGVALDQLEGKAVGTRKLQVKRYPRVAVVSDCHVLFISRSELDRLELILRTIEYQPILTVSDIDDFSARGGMITLSTRDRRVRFAVNPHVAASAGLEISSKLLELATIVVSRR